MKRTELINTLERILDYLDDINVSINHSRDLMRMLKRDLEVIE